MSPSLVRILLIDDSPGDRVLAITMLRASPSLQCDVIECSSMGEALECLADQPVDVILLDLCLPDSRDIDTIRSLREFDRERPLIVLTGQNSDEKGIAALQEGAQEYLCKDELTPGALSRAILYAIKRKHLEDELRQARLDEQAAHSELKRAQTQLIQSTKMAALGQFTAGVCHELNNPLSYVCAHAGTIARISGKLSALLRDRSRSDVVNLLEKLTDRCVEIETGVGRISDIVSKLKLFSHLHGRTFQKIDVRENIISTLSLLNHLYADRIAVKIDLDDVSHLNCMPGPFNQLLFNLVTNAIEAIENKGEINIFARQSDTHYILGIADSGAGIPADIREKIFEPFFTTKPVGMNAGLGLAIAYNIVKAHNGSLELEPGSAAGSKFIVTIPKKT